MSVLAHLVSRSLPPEPAATQALAYILREPEALSAFVAGLAFTGVSFEPTRVEAEKTHGTGKPDLSIYDDRGAHRVFVENKFWAGLTEAQPMAYLNELPQDETAPSALVFVVPTTRIPSVWGELIRRCAESALEIGGEVGGSATVSAKLPGNRVIAVTSWKRVLDGLEVVTSVEPDVRQLRGLTETMDAEAFLPIRPDELTNVELARRLINYADLVELIVEELKRREVADTSGLRPSHNYHATGRYLYMHDRLGLWLGVDLDLWRDAGTTPLWWEMDGSDWSGVEGVWDELDGMFDDIQTRGGSKCVPVRLETGVERDAVIAHAANQMVAIADRIMSALSN